MDKRLTSIWWMLKIGLGAATLLAGVDKFFNALANWTDFLNPTVLRYVPVSPEIFMQGVGVAEILVGLLILTRGTRLGSYLSACWLVAVAVNLFSMGKFYDVAVRDLLVAFAYFSLARLTALRRAAPAAPAAAGWKPVEGDILRLGI